MNENNRSSFRLTKVGVVILALTLIFSILFITLGIVDLVDSSERYLVNRGDNGFPVDTGEYYTLVFNATQSDTYKLKINGAYITDITDAYGNTVSFDYNPNLSYSYEYAYSAELYGGNVYEITIFTSYSYVDFYID